MIDVLFGKLGRGVVRFRWVILIIWVLGIGFASHAFPTLASQVNNNNSEFLPASAPSNQAADLAKPLIGSITQAKVTVVAVTSDGTLDSADQSALTALAGDLHRVPTVKSVTRKATSPNQKAQLLQVVSTVSPFDQAGTKKLVDNLESTLQKADLPSGLQANLAGSVATNVANQEQSNKQSNEIQFASIIFILILLVVIFRALLAPVVTLLGPVFALSLSTRFIGALGEHGLKISFFTQILLIVLLLGAGTDYGLFLVFRVREELLKGRTTHEAVANAMARVGESITASAGTVILALLTLTLASFGIYHDLGIPLAIGIGVMLLAGLTLLPALLAIFGRAVFWPTKTAPREHKEGYWGRIAGRLVEHPALTLAIGVVAFGALAACTLGYKSGGFGGKVTAPAGTSAAKGNAALAANYPQSSANPTNVIMTFATSVWDDPTPLAVASDGLAKTGQFTAISGPLDPNGTPLTGAQLVQLHQELGSPKQLAQSSQAPPASVPADEYFAYLATANFISTDGTTIGWYTNLKAGDPQSTSALHAIPAIRTDVTQVAKQAGATASGVAGEAPALYDVSSISGGDLVHIIPVAVVAIGLLLVLVLRSLIAPLYLILSVVLSYLASLGLSVLFFMKIGGKEGIVFLLPFLMFIFLLALGEDYNILVMTRIREEARRLPLRQAVVRAVGATGPTVTSAGLVLAGSFVVLGVVGGRGATGTSIQEIGFGLAVGILLDTFVVRTVLVPSTVALLGRWNWWPSAMGRKPAAHRQGGSPGGPGGLQESEPDPVGGR